MFALEMRSAVHGFRSFATMAGALAGVGFAMAAIAVHVFYVQTATGQQLDVAMWPRFADLNPLFIDIASFVRAQTPIALAAVAVLFAVIGWEKGRRRVVLWAGAQFVLSVAIGQGLKMVLGRPFLGDAGYAYNTFPAGQTIVVTSLVFGILMMWPGSVARFRATATITAGAIVAVTGLSAIVTMASRPSDVLGAIFIAAAVGIPCAIAAKCDVVPHVPSGVVWAAVSAVVTAVAFSLIARDADTSGWKFGLLGTSTVLFLCGALALVGSAMSWSRRDAP